MKLIIVILTLFTAVLTQENTNEVHGMMTLASIWNRNSTTIISFSRFGSIISDKHILANINGLGNLTEYIGVTYGLYDISEVNIGNTDLPKKITVTFAMAVLEMEKIGCNTRLACILPFFNFNDEKLTILGHFVESGKIKSFNVIKVENSQCSKRFGPIVEKRDICLSRKQDTGSDHTPFQWFNPENKKWYVVAVEWSDHEADLVEAHNVSDFQPWIQKIVEDGTLDALC